MSFWYPKYVPNQSILAISCAVGDVVNGTVRLRLSTIVNGVLNAMALAEKRACQKWASVLSINIMIGINEIASVNAVAHVHALPNSVNQSVGQIVVTFDGPAIIVEYQFVAIVVRGRGLMVRRLGAKEAKLQ